MLTHLLLEIAGKLGQLTSVVIKFIEEELRPLTREARGYLAEKRVLRAEAMSETPAVEPPEPDEKLYNRKGAAEFLLVDPRTVTRYRVSGKLRFVYNEGDQIRYRESDLAACYFWKWGKRPPACAPDV